MCFCMCVSVCKDSANKMVVLKGAQEDSVSSEPLAAGGDVICSCKSCWIRSRLKTGVGNAFPLTLAYDCCISPPSGSRAEV